MDDSLRDNVSFLLSTPVFSSIPQEELKKIAHEVEECSLAAKEILFHQGSVGDSLYIVKSGKLKIFVTSSDGLETVLAYSGPGNFIGEMSLLTDEPRSASVQAVEDSILLVISKPHFDQLLTDYPYLAKAFVSIISGYLRKSNLSMVQKNYREAALQKLLSQQRQQPEERLIGKSKAIATLGRDIKKVAAVDSPTLICSEQGTEQSVVAQLIHENSSRFDQVFFVIDCADILPVIPLSESQESTFTKESPFTEGISFLMGISEDSAIFGHEEVGASFAESQRIGHLEVADSGTLLLKNIDKLQPSVQVKLAAYLRNGNFSRWGGSDVIQSNVRVIATTNIDLAQAVKNNSFNQDLYEQLSQQSLSIEPLRNRKEDIPELVKYFLNRYSQESQKRVDKITKSAMKQIRNYDWPGNVEELSVVIRRGVYLTSDEKLTLQEISIGLLDEKYRFNLLRFEWLRRIFEDRLFPSVLQILSLAFFGIILFSGLFGPEDAKSNIASILTWGIWWPMLTLSFLFAARFWCSVCPIATIAGWFNRLYNFGFKAPSFLREYGIHFSLAGFAFIIWFEQITQVSVSPSSTSWLLLIILASAIVTGLFFNRRAWCRYLCPLGGMAGTFATVSVIELRADLTLCDDCKTRDCFDKDMAKGCPMYKGASSLRSNEHCVLCGNCIKICESQSPKINLRPPAIELIQDRGTKTDPSSLGLAFFVSVLIGSLFTRELEGTHIYQRFAQIFGTEGPMTVLIILSTIIFGIFWLGGIILLRSSGKPIEKFYRLSLAFIPLAFAGELAHQLERLLSWAGQLIPIFGRQIDFDYLQNFGIQTTSATIHGLQIITILFGAITTLIVCKRTIANYTNDEYTHPKWKLHLLVWGISITYLILFFQGG